MKTNAKQPGEPCKAGQRLAVLILEYGFLDFYVADSTAPTCPGFPEPLS